MNELKKYIKYYNLEEYLFGEVSENFKERGFLMPDEFFAIVIWKSNRAKTKVREGIRNSGKTIQSITSQIAAAKTREEKIEVVEMLKLIDGVGIPIASAILTVCRPEEFTVVDYRARAALQDLKKEIKGDPTADPAAYLEYVDVCGDLAKEGGLSLRDIDRSLWGKDFFEGKDGLISFVEGLK